MDKIIGYIRSSTLKQTITPKNQESKIKRYCKDNNLDLVELIKQEGISGGKINTEGFKRLWETIETNMVDGMIVWDWDRVGRTLIELLQLEQMCYEKGVYIIDLMSGLDTRTPGGSFSMKQKSLYAENELLRIKERTQEAIRYKKTNGLKYNGTTPYGVYVKNGVLYEDGYEMKVVRNIKNKRTRGWSWYKIKKQMNEVGIPTKQEGKNGWSETQLIRVYNYHYGSTKPVLVK
jgi:DNA invertase Pin-like site-specific DNA recombinase